VKLAIRAEGEFVVAYWSAMDMYADPADPPLEVARFRKAALERTPGVYEEWRGLLRRVIEQACRDKGLPVPEWSEVRAPESERLGEA